MNTLRSLLLAHGIAALCDVGTYYLLGADYLAGGTARILTIILMIVLDAVHPPAVSTSLSFAFRTGSESTAVLFVLALVITAMLVALQRAAVWPLARFERE